MFRIFRNIIRLIEIIKILAKFDSLQIISDHLISKSLKKLISLFIHPNREIKNMREGNKLSHALTALGPTFIKFGQALSTRPDIVGENMANDLAELQDQLPPFSFEEAKRIINEELDGGIDGQFAYVEPIPNAAASIAQVHFATTKEGAEVAIKVLRPLIKEAFSKDLDLFLWLAEIIERKIPKMQRLKPIETIKTFEKTFYMEIDLRYEAAAAEELKEFFDEEPKFKVPSVDWQRTSERVLTIERVSGVRVDNADGLKKLNIDPLEIVETAATIFFKMVFYNGFFHADMHPGNIFIGDDGTIIVMDFGIMGRIDKKNRLYLGEMLMGFLTRNYKKVADVHIKAGYVSSNIDTNEFAQACRSITEPILGKPLNQISIAKLLSQLFQITATFEMELQTQLILLQKSMLLIEGVGRKLAPEVNMWELTKPLIEEWMIDEFSPEKKVINSILNTLESLEHIPDLLEKLNILIDQLNKKYT